MTDFRGIFRRAVVDTEWDIHGRYWGSKGFARYYADLVRGVRSPHLALCATMSIAGYSLAFFGIFGHFPIPAFIGLVVASFGFEICYIHIVIRPYESIHAGVASHETHKAAIEECQRLRARLILKEREVEDRITRAQAEAFAAGLLKGRQGYFIQEFETGLDETG